MAKRTKKPTVKSVDSRRIRVFSKNFFTPTAPSHIMTLPTEITEQILSLAIDPTRFPIDQQWHKIYQAIVCRDWYKLRRERTKFVFVSVRQVNAMLGMINSGEIDVNGITELNFNSVNETAGGRVEAFERLIRSCPKVERLAILLNSAHYTSIYNRPIDSASTVWRSMEALDLKFLCMRSGISRSDFIRTVPFWKNLKEVDLDFGYDYSSPNHSSFITTAPIETVRLRYSFLPAFLSCLTSRRKLKHLDLRGYFENREGWKPVLAHHLPTLESLVISGDLVDAATLSLGQNLKLFSSSSSSSQNLILNDAVLESLTSLRSIVLRDYAYEKDLDGELTEWEQKILPITFPHPVHLEIIIQSRFKNIVHSESHSMFSTVLSKGITLELTNEVLD